MDVMNLHFFSENLRICNAFPMSLHPHTQTLDSSYSCPPQSFRWLIRSLIYPPSDITVSLQPPPPPHTLLTGLGEELEVEVVEGELARRLRLSETTETPSVRARAGHGDAGGKRQHGRPVAGPGPGDGGDGPPPAEEALAEGDLPL